MEAVADEVAYCRLLGQDVSIDPRPPGWSGGESLYIDFLRLLVQSRCDTAARARARRPVQRVCRRAVQR